MQPFKGRNSNNLIFCDASAKKAPEPPDSNDSSKPAILKALEAVVAAGRRGLLGPEAVAAVEAMPESDLEFYNREVGQKAPSPAPLVSEKDLEFYNREVGQKAPSPAPLVSEKDLEFYNREVGQKAPSPAPLVEEKEEEPMEEEKAAEKPCSTAVSVMPPIHGTGSAQPFAKKEIWICGNSVISHSSERAERERRLCFGFPPSAAYVYWRGIPTVLWDDVLPMLYQVYHYRPAPSIIVIHVGETDLLLDTQCSLITRMQSDLGILKRAFPDVVIIWSSLLPKYFCTTSDYPQVLESERYNVNCKMEKFCNEIDICYIPHPLITAEKKDLFLHDNSLSNAALDVFITDLEKVLMPYVYCAQQFVCRGSGVSFPT